MNAQNIPEKIHLGIYGICVRDGKVLMIRKGRGPYKGLFDLPGGKMEPGETFEQALHRELCEEIGVNVLSHAPLCVSEYQCTWMAEAEKKAFHHVALYNTVVLESATIKTDPDGHDSEGASWVAHPIASADVAPITHHALRMLGLLQD